MRQIDRAQARPAPLNAVSCGMRRRVLTGLAAALLVSALTAATAHAQNVQLTILHSSDVNEISPRQGIGGFAEFMTLLRAERARGAHTITTFGGDLISPSVLSGLTQGAQMIDLTNAIGVDVAVVGNHELDFGPEIAAERFAASSYPWLAANMLDLEGNLALGAAAHHVIEVEGYTIGFFGLVTPDTAFLSQPGDQIVFADPIETATAMVEALTGMGADVIIALTHQTYTADRALAAVDGIDLVLGGHDHKPTVWFEDGVMILKAGAELHHMSAVDLSIERVESRGEERVVVTPLNWRFVTTAGVEPDPEIGALVASWNEKLDAELGVEVGMSEVELDTRRSEVRARESNFGNLVADAMRRSTNADVAITNGGGIRGDRLYEPGTVLTHRDILTELPFGNVVVVLEITGAGLLAALENGVSRVEEGAGRFPQISGMAVTWDASRPAGERIVEVVIGDSPLDPQATYRLATNDYMAGGGDGYDALGEAAVIIDAAGGNLMASSVINYVTALGGKIAVQAEGRITRLN